MIFLLYIHERLNHNVPFKFWTKEVKAKTYKSFDFAVFMKEKKKRNGISENTYRKIANHILTAIIIVEMIGITVSIASYVVPYSEATVILCECLHKCSIISAWSVGILLGVFEFCK